MTSHNRRVIRCRAPIRIDLAGGWTDVPPYSAEAGGATVNIGINRYTYATLVPRDDEGIRIISADFDRSLEIRSYRELEYDNNLDLIKAAIKRLGIEIGMDLYVRCDAPPSSGTGSSASISVALIGLLNQMQENRLSRHEIAKLANKLEIEELHIAGGKQDQYGAALGGINFLEFNDPSVDVSRLNVRDETVAELEKHFVLCYTGQARLSGTIISTVMGAYQAGNPSTVNALHRMKALAHEMKSALLKGDTDTIGGIMAENWECQKALDPSVTNSQINALFDLAASKGSRGGKALGAGGGGCLLFYAAPDEEHVLRRALEEAKTEIIDFNIDMKGLQTWHSR